MNSEGIKTTENIASIEQQSVYKYHVEPTLNEEMPYIPPNTNLMQKAGFLTHRTYDWILCQLASCDFLYISRQITIMSSGFFALWHEQNLHKSKCLDFIGS